MNLIYIGEDIEELKGYGFKDDENKIYPKYMVKGNVHVKSEKTFQLGHKCKFGLLETQLKEGHRVFVDHSINDALTKEFLSTGLFKELSEKDIREYDYSGW